MARAALVAAALALAAAAIAQHALQRHRAARRATPRRDQSRLVQLEATPDGSGAWYRVLTRDPGACAFEQYVRAGTRGVVPQVRASMRPKLTRVGRRCSCGPAPASACAGSSCGACPSYCMFLQLC